MHAIEVAKSFETWVICKKQGYEEDIKTYLSRNRGTPQLHFRFVPVSRFEGFLRRIPGLWYAAHNLWHRRAYRLAVGLHKELQFDLAHQITLSSYREPGYLWKLDVPFVWGPVGGLEDYPWRFLRCAGAAGALKEGLRTLANALQFRFSPRVRKAIVRASVLLAGNSTVKRALEQVHGASSVLMHNVGCYPPGNAAVRFGETSRPLRILWSGLFQHRKALHLLIMALSGLPASVRYELRILGRGPLKRRWLKMARRLGVASRCLWMGWLPREEVDKQYDWADVFVFTSLRDMLGSVNMEALSHGLPVICLDQHGAGDVVTAECGIKVPVTTPEDAISGLREAIAALAQDRGKLQALSRGAIRRAGECLWSRKGRRLADLYRSVL